MNFLGFDDSEVIVLAYHERFAECGHAYAGATNFPSFISLLKTQEYSAVLLDYETGIPFDFMVNTVRNQYEGPIVLLCSKEPETCEQISRQQKLSGWVSKPSIMSSIGMSDLERIVRSCN